MRYLEKGITNIVGQICAQFLHNSAFCKESTMLTEFVDLYTRPKKIPVVLVTCHEKIRVGRWEKNFFFSNFSIILAVLIS